jgi:hypothetical protein
MAATNINASTGIRPVRINKPELNMVDPLFACVFIATVTDPQPELGSREALYKMRIP